MGTIWWKKYASVVSWHKTPGMLQVHYIHNQYIVYMYSVFVTFQLVASKKIAPWSPTTVWIASGFCTLRALTIWNTSTTPSVLHLSMVVTMAQNIPHSVTVGCNMG